MAHFSIISPCLNGMPFIHDALASIRDQNFTAVEHIVVDGGSSDGSREFLARCRDVRLVDAPGSSIYEALNIGLDHARGDRIGFLNVDDRYCAGAFAAVDALCRDAGTLIVCGRAELLDQRAGAGPHAQLRQEGDVWTRTMLGDPCINAWFFSRRVFERCGRFDTRYRIAGDRELLLRMLASGLQVHELHRVVYSYRAHAASTTFAGAAAVWRRTLVEHNLMTSTWLAQPNLTARMRRELRTARTRDTLAGALYAVHSHDVPGFLSHVRAGLRHDPCWPARLAVHAWRAARRWPTRQPGGPS